MNIVILDGRALNPGDLSWDIFREFGTVTYYPQTDSEEETITAIKFVIIASLLWVKHKKERTTPTTSRSIFSYKSSPYRWTIPQLEEERK